MLTKFAKLIRFITVPPIIVTAELLLLFFFEDVFPAPLDFWLALFFLGILPALAYPLQRLIPAFRSGGQRAQRRLAFILSPLGYIGALIAAILRDAVPNLLYIAAVYLFSVVLLLVFNKLTPLRASGHGCSLSGSIILPCLFLGGFAVVPGILLFVLSFWASVYLKRHTVREFLLGAAIAALSALVCFFLIHPGF